MDCKLMPLHLLPIGSIGRIFNLTAAESTRRRMLDLGFIRNTLVEALQRSPSGDPTAYQVRGAVIALRSEEAANIIVEIC
ncbi:MAG: FeoA family protein [Peptococcia bacterium]